MQLSCFLSAWESAWKVFPRWSQGVSWGRPGPQAASPRCCFAHLYWVCRPHWRSERECLPRCMSFTVCVHPENPVERSPGLPWGSFQRNGGKGIIPIDSPPSTPIHVPEPWCRDSFGKLHHFFEADRIWSTSYISFRWRGGRGKNYLFYLGNVKVTICSVSPTFKALHPLNCYMQILLLSTSIIIKF